MSTGECKTESVKQSQRTSTPFPVNDEHLSSAIDVVNLQVIKLVVAMVQISLGNERTQNETQSLASIPDSS